MASPQGWKRFVASPWFRVLYLVLLSVLTALLFPFAFGPAACLALLVIPLTTFVVPYWFGERKPRRFVVNGLVVLAISLPVIAGLQTSVVVDFPPFSLESVPDPGVNATVSLTNGTVVPFRAQGPAAFTFRVLLTTTENGTASDFEVWLNLTTGQGFSFPSRGVAMAPEASSEPNTRDGTWFTTTTSLGDEVYYTGFSAQRIGENWTRTFASFGPVTGSWGTYFGYLLLLSAPLLSLTLVFYFMILFMWWYTGRMRARIGRPATSWEPEGVATASDGGKAGKAAAFTCTNCGADVSEADTKCPKCGAAFED